jgi:lipopolysaccharide biosynthesis glycosyltransferase
MSYLVTFSIHDGFGQYWNNLAVGLNSLLLNASCELQRVCVLHDETLSDSAKASLNKICLAHSATLTFIKVKLPTYLANANYGAFSPASIFRLGIPKLFKDHEQVVYLDCDLIFHGVDIAELVAAAGDAPLAAVRDPYIGRPQKHREQLAALGLDPSNYFNSGVLVMRPKELPDDLIARFMAFAKKNRVMSHPDQDFLNVQFKGLWKPIDGKFNHQACAFDRSLFQPISSYAGKVIHFAGKVKPLQGALAPAFVPFWMYAQAIPDAAVVFDLQPTSLLEPDPNNPDGVLMRRIAQQPKDK